MSMRRTENKESYAKLADTDLSNICGGKDTVNFIHDGKTTCTLIVENKKVVSLDGNLKDVPKDVFIIGITQKESLNLSNEEAEKMYKDLTSH